MRNRDKDRRRRRIHHTLQKVRRTFTAFLPVNREREGQCERCGECCKMGWTCPFLAYVDENGKRLASCRIRHIRPMNCRSYPRTRGEQLVFPCGYQFGNGDNNEESTK